MEKHGTPELADDQMCFGCGRENARGLQLKFEIDSQKQEIRTRWIPAKEFQGYAHIVHGGMTALVLDELMVNLLWVLEKRAITAELNVRFHRPASVGEPLDFEARIGAEEGRIFRMEAEAKNAQGEIVARATARCVRV